MVLFLPNNKTWTQQHNKVGAIGFFLKKKKSNEGIGAPSMYNEEKKSGESINERNR